MIHLKNLQRLFRGLKMMRQIEVGDKVNCFDGSFSFGIKHGKFSSFGISTYLADRNNLTVVAVNLAIKDRCNDDVSQPCDTLVTNGNGDFWFVQSELCKLIPQMHTITIDDKDIEISDESYENLKRQLVD